jgi:hypothetical protein
MRLLPIVLILFITSCTQAISQKPSTDLKSDQDFYELLKKAKATRETIKLSIQSADEHTKQVVTKTVTNINNLKTSVEELKTDLNEANKKLDSVVDANTGNPYKLLPISKVSYN